MPIRQLAGAVGCLLLVVPTGQALAIPSPDLVINLSASVAQLFGLLSVVFGGLAFSAKGRAKKGQRKNSGASKVLLIVASVMLLLSLAANALQYTMAVDAKNQRLHTNLVRKSVENGEAVGDASLKTLSFSEQIEHPQGISTETLAEWLASDKPLNIIDVRENEEFEMGSIEGASHLRYPDVLARSSLIPENSNTLFLCYSGNRSSELCTEFTKQGRSCNFMIGGYEKWMTESRPLSSKLDLTIEDLRQIPSYPNDDVLLDTPDVHKLVQEEGAEFVDVRYPGDFVKDHLPNAHNITMRALSSVALAERVAALPEKPLIAACYDKRSCFYSRLIGLRISREGGDFRGRYTVPHEYYINASADRAHVAAWKEAQQQLTLASYVVAPMQSLLERIVDYSGHYVFALLGIVLLTRLALLPFALKAERDTQVQRSLKGRVAALRKEFENHPRALSEATLALYRKYRIRPLINTLASLFQLTLLLLFYSAVSQSATDWPHTLLWLESASAPDPMRVLPVLASALFVGVLCLQIRPDKRWKQAVFALSGMLLFALLQSLGAAVNLYLAMSMAFLITQSLVFRWLGERFGWSTLGMDKRGTIEDTGLIPLEQAHYLPFATGKKAARLGELIEAGYRVPDGFVFTSAITNRARCGEKTRLLDREQKKQLAGLWRSLRTERVAVRSSGANEDGVDNSFAGVYESILNVTREELLGAVRTVYLSLDSDRSSAYTSHTGTSTSVVSDAAVRDEGGVVVQKMVPAEYAGVMFTEHPSHAGAMMVECVSGLAEELVSGNVTPKTFAFGRVSGEHLVEQSGSDEAPRLDLQPLLQLGREIEKLFGMPQDIEWAYANGEFYLLQARDITRSITRGNSARAVAEAERGKLLTQLLDLADGHAPGDPVFEEKVFVQNELAELLPRPTPLSADLMSKLWAAGGSTDLACADLDIPYDVNYCSPPYITTVFGWTYVNKREEARRLGKGPGAVASFRLARNAEAMQQAFLDNFLPGYRAEMLERDALDMQRLTLEKAVSLLDYWIERFVTDTYYQAELINIAADYHTKTALSKLHKAGLEATMYLNDEEDTVVGKAMSLLRGSEVSAAHIEQFLEIFGHRAPLDYELAAPRFNEDPSLVAQYIQRSEGHNFEHAGHKRHTPPELPDSKVLKISVTRARDFQRLKEEAKHECLRELAQIRRLLLAIGEQTELGDRIFQLRLEEVSALADSNRCSGLLSLAHVRYDTAASWQDRQLPSALSVSDLEHIDMLTGKRSDVSQQGELAGKRVAGEAEVVGSVRVITDVSQIETFEKGEILVARMTDPTWYPLFSQARGILTEVGGWLSHAAIVAREYDLPAIVGVTGICNTLTTGDIVRLKLDGTIERVANRRSDESPLRVLGNRSIDADTAVTTQDTAPIASAYVSKGGAGVTKLRERMDRRQYKNRLSDRRAQLRFDDDGLPHRDRRAINRAAFRHPAYRKAS